MAAGRSSRWRCPRESSKPGETATATKPPPETSARRRPDERRSAHWVLVLGARLRLTASARSRSRFAISICCLSGPFFSGPGHLEQHRQLLEALVGEEADDAVLADLARRRGWRGGRGSSRAASSSRSGAAPCRRSSADVAFGTRRSTSLAAAGGRGSRNPRRAGGRSRGRRRRRSPPPVTLDQLAQLLEVAPDRVAGAGRVLEQQRAATRSSSSALRQAVADHLDRRRRGRGPCRCRGGRSRRRRRSRRRPRSACVSDASDLLPHLGVVAGDVDQVDGVDEDRLDRACRRSARGRPRSPPPCSAVGRHMRGLWLKICIVSAPISSPRSIALSRPPDDRDVGAD